MVALGRWQDSPEDCKAHFVAHMLCIIMQEELEHVLICPQQKLQPPWGQQSRGIDVHLHQFKTPPPKAGCKSNALVS
jgi:hypothetical protein